VHAVATKVRPTDAGLAGSSVGCVSLEHSLSSNGEYRVVGGGPRCGLSIARLFSVLGGSLTFACVACFLVRLLCSRELPDQSSGGGVQGIDAAVSWAESTHVRRAGIHAGFGPIATSIGPYGVAGSGTQAVNAIGSNVYKTGKCSQ